MKAEIIDPRVEPVPEAWEKLRTAEGLSDAWNPRALSALAWTSPWTVYLGLVFDKDTPVGLFVGDFGRYHRLKTEYARPGRPSFGFYFCRLLAGFNQGFAFDGALNDDDRRRACRAFELALRKRLGLRCFGIVYCDVTEESVGLVDGWFRLSRPVAPNVVLRNTWQDMDAYFADLPRSRRRTFGNIYRRVNESHEVEAIGGLNSIDPAQASRLEAAIRRKYLPKRGTLFPVPHHYFSQLNGQPSVRYFTHRIPKSNILESFDLSFIDNGAMYCTFTGSRESPMGKRLQLYHDQYLRQISFMIEHGLHTIEFGKGMIELKERFGCVQSPQFAVAAAF